MAVTFDVYLELFGSRQPEAAREAVAAVFRDLGARGPDESEHYELPIADLQAARGPAFSRLRAVVRCLRREMGRNGKTRLPHVEEVIIERRPPAAGTSTIRARESSRTPVRSDATT